MDISSPLIAPTLPDIKGALLPDFQLLLAGKADIATTITEDQLLSKYRTVSGTATASTDDMYANVMGSKPVFVSDAPLTLAALFASFPAGAANVGKYARVSDLWGTVRTVMICESDASGYYWRPQRTDYPTTLTIAQGNMNLIPLVTAPFLLLTGTLTGNVNFTPTTSNVWPGATFDVAVKTAIPALVSVNINGLVGGGTIPLLQGSTKRISYFPGAGWNGV